MTRSLYREGYLLFVSFSFYFSLLFERAAELWKACIIWACRIKAELRGVVHDLSERQREHYSCFPAVCKRIVHDLLERQREH